MQISRWSLTFWTTLVCWCVQCWRRMWRSLASSSTPPCTSSTRTPPFSTWPGKSDTGNHPGHFLMREVMAVHHFLSVRWKAFFPKNLGGVGGCVCAWFLASSFLFCFDLCLIKYSYIWSSVFIFHSPAVANFGLLWYVTSTLHPATYWHVASWLKEHTFWWHKKLTAWFVPSSYESYTTCSSTFS